eukprot:395843_1
MHYKCYSVIEKITSNIEMYILLLKFNKILLIQTQRNKSYLKQEINHKYGEFYKSIYECEKKSQDRNNEKEKHQSIKLMEKKLEPIILKQNELNQRINSILKSIHNLSTFYAMFHGKSNNDSKTEGIKAGIKTFSDNISSFPNEPYFYFMRA